jgi:hypothetical protein
MTLARETKVVKEREALVQWMGSNEELDIHKVKGGGVGIVGWRSLQEWSCL